MSNIYVNRIGVPRKPRNKRNYGGNSFVFSNVTSESSGGGGSGARHFEIGTVENLATEFVNIFFTEPFDTLPTMLQFKVYRMVEIATNKWVMQDVLWYQSSNDGRPYTTDGIEIVIDTSESLTGVIIEYAFA